ncbi:MAG: aspartate--tRNA ligase [Clostridia bacterium]
MVDFLGGLKRSKMCGEFSAKDIGSKATVMGFIAKYRNLGNLLFVDVRDRTGIVQVCFDKSINDTLFEKSTRLRNEFVVAIVGTVRSRGENINKTLPTGEVEVLADELKILSEADVTPFAMNDENVGEMTKLKYRYLDLRRSNLQSKLIMRDKITRVVRNYFSDNGFLEIETPFLGKSTPEGARDYLVPSRIHTGAFYALPQSPQLFKQLLMISGFDRYYQIARCFRDEDLRANRQPEFSQIDMEMSFVNDENDVIDIAEGFIKKVFNECLGMSFDKPFRRLTWQYAMDTYGSDKPDTRFDLKINDLSDILKDSNFSVFASAIAEGGSVRAINAKGLANSFTRKDIDACAPIVKDFKAKGLAWISLKDTVTSSFLKFLSEEEIASIYKRLNAETGDLLFFVADSKNQVVCEGLGALRLHIANKCNLFDKNNYDFLWVVDFPLLEFSEEENRFVAIHHPFTAPKEEDIPLLDIDPIKVRSQAYDMVINGQEAGGGSIRIHNPQMQEKMFGLLGFSAEDIKRKFGFFVDAFRYGTPPHGGLAFGWDRLTKLITKTDNIKDVIAFPKVQNASCLMSDAPDIVETKQMKELHLEIKE